MDQFENIFVDCSLESVKNNLKHHKQIYNYSFTNDFSLCKNVEISTKYCWLTKNYLPVRSYCFPQSCDGRKIQFFVGNVYHGDNETYHNLQCRNIVDPTILFVYFGAFLTLIAMITLISTIIYSYPLSCFKFLPSKFQEYFQFFSIFSLSENLKTLFNTKSSSSSIDCLNGLKALSLILIVILHSFQAAWPYPDSKFYVKLLNVTGILPTDTFFVVSGILCAKFYVTRGNLFSKFFKTLFERYMRLIPSKIVVILVYFGIKLLLTPLDLNNLLTLNIEECKSSWWAVLLFIQNYYNRQRTCLVTFYYSAILFQLYFITPFILLIIEKLKPNVHKIFMVIALLLTFVPGFVTGFYNQSGYTFLMYDVLTRSYPYLIGLFYYWLTSSSVKLEASQIKLGWTATLLTFILALIPFFTDALTKEILNFFYIPVRISWSFAICWIVHACHNKFGGLVDKILSAKLLIPISNLSLGIYLVNGFASQMLPLMFHSFSLVESNLVNTIRFFAANWVISSFCAILLYLCIEVPFHRMSRMNFEQKSKPYSYSILETNVTP